MQNSAELTSSSSEDNTTGVYSGGLDEGSKESLYPNMSNLLSAIELENENAQLKQQLEYLKKTLLNNEDEMHRMEEELADLSSRYKDLLIDHEKQMYELEAKNDDNLSRLRDELTKQKQAHRDFENKIEMDKIASVDYKQKYETQAKRLEMVEEQRDANLASYEEAARERNLRQEQLEKKELRLSQLEDNLTTKKDQLVEVSKEAVKLQKMLDEEVYEKSVLYAKAKASDLLYKKLQLLTRFYQQLKELYAKTSDRNIDLTTELEGLRKNRSDRMVDDSKMTKDFCKMKKKVIDLDDEMDLKMNIITSLEGDLEDAKSLHSRYKQEILKLQDVAANAVKKQELLQVKIEAEIISQEVLKLAIEKEFKVIGEVLGTFAEQNLETMKRWDDYIRRKGRNIQHIMALTEQIGRIKDDSSKTEIGLIEGLQEYLDLEPDKTPDSD